MDPVPRGIPSGQDTKIDVTPTDPELEEERDRLERATRGEPRAVGYLVFATDPERAPEEPGYRKGVRDRGETPAEVAAKVRPLAEGRRLRTYLATGMFTDELADARWVASAAFPEVDATAKPGGVAGYATRT